MVPIIRGWLAIGAAENMPLHFETAEHYTFTNDLYIALQLLDAIPEMEMSADLSHYAVDRELYLPLSATLKSQFGQVLDRSASFQGGASPMALQIQVPLNFPQHAPWLELFKGWWTDGFRRWRARKPAGEDVVFLCELGPPAYAITDADGRELSDRWAEAQQLRDIAKACWVASA